ncbi:RNA polymerase sigma factor [Pyxidicoccus xibeiensis]|uniref:RNA polymerase sigma factor n=1 Tax=Pyxidicoccus xibeiensis TaxID=2906759 RepID=UPI0020A74DDE|nr:sigma-70 family RNA polymerase sigma factor [Pyxidicoccus xibeiensis]MCP3136086.1 sigma-70 family RNA polymerase sigma factor [Pyxidicoccus xibeiensis]
MDSAARQELQQWMARLADGDRSAFAPAFGVLHPLVLRFCSRLLPDGEDAEDAAQSALLKVFTRASDFDASRDALPWVLSLAAYECRTSRKARQRRREEAPPDESVPDVREEGPEARLACAQLAAALRDVLEELRPEDAATLAAAMGEVERPAVPPATFRKRLERAMTRLRAAWRTRHGVE